jgi:hypothetical protein
VSTVDAETEAESAVTGSAETLPAPLTLPYAGLLFVSRPAPGPQAEPIDSFVHDLNLDQIVESIACGCRKRHPEPSTWTFVGEAMMTKMERGALLPLHCLRPSPPVAPFLT